MSQLFPWLTLVAVIWIQSISSTNTDFSAYSSSLKSHLTITQVRLNILAVASDAGKLFGWCSGIAASRLPLWAVLAIGSTIGSIGYGFQFLFLANKLSVAYWQYLFLQVLAGNSICWFNTACYVAAMRSFPVDYPFVIGLSTSYAGLSAKIYIAIAQVVAGKKFSNKNIYLLLNCLVPLVLSLITAPFLKERTPVQTGSLSVLLLTLVIAVATGAYAVVETLVPTLNGSVVLPMILLLMVGLVAGIPIIKASEKVQDCDEVPVRVTEDAGNGVAESRKEDLEQGSVREGDESEMILKKEGCMFEALSLVTSIDFWLYFLCICVGVRWGSCTPITWGR